MAHALKQIFVLVVCLIVGALCGLRIEWTDSISLKLLIGLIYGSAIGVLAFDDKCNISIMYLVTGLSTALFSTAGIVVFFASSTATVGSLLIMALVIPTVLFWCCTRT